MNWEPLPVAPRDIDAVVLTHAHVDHSGYLPLLVKNGFAGRIFCTEATRDLCSILLPDSGHLQEEDAEYANRKHFTKHEPATALYTQRDAERALGSFTALPWEVEHYLGGGLWVRFSRAGHILGAALVHLRDTESRMLFSGDLGRYSDPVMAPPSPVRRADFLVVESTYGDRSHGDSDPAEDLAVAVRRTAARRGVLLVPTFAVGRAQTLLYLVQKLKADKTIPDIPVFVNSPMAIDVTDLFCRHRVDHKLDPATCRATCHAATMVSTVEDSRALNERSGPMMILSASGMLTGGRILHHLKAFAPDPRNTILLVGYQAAGTRGAALQNGARTLRVHGREVDVGAEVVTMSNLSAHADAGEILTWLRGFESAPQRTFITHGEPAAASALKLRIERELGWKCELPKYRQLVHLSGETRSTVAELSR
jgi:metallo-beta-lactamase family protein